MMQLFYERSFILGLHCYSPNKLFWVQMLSWRAQNILWSNFGGYVYYTYVYIYEWYSSTNNLNLTLTHFVISILIHEMTSLKINMMAIEEKVVFGGCISAKIPIFRLRCPVVRIAQFTAKWIRSQRYSSGLNFFPEFLIYISQQGW